MLIMAVRQKKTAKRKTGTRGHGDGATPISLSRASCAFLVAVLRCNAMNYSYSCTLPWRAAQFFNPATGPSIKLLYDSQAQGES
jgi:hypothetical protein